MRTSKLDSAWHTTAQSVLLVSVAFFLLLSVSGVTARTVLEAVSPPAAGEVSTETVEGRLAVFDDTWQTIHDRYYDLNFRGVDWKQQFATLRPQAAEASSTGEFYAVLRRLIASLNDVHTRVYSPQEKFDWWKPRFVGVGLSVREIEGRPTVVHVEKHSTPERIGVQPGDVIEQVGGSTALSLLDREFSNHNRASTRLRVLATLLQGAPKTKIELVWRQKNNKMRRAEFQLEWRKRELGLKISQRGNFGVVEIDAFTPTIALEFNRTIRRRFSKAQGIVLDLRGNGGGDTEAMIEVASTLLGEEHALGKFTDRYGASFTINTRSRSLFSADTLTQTKLPLVVLVGERTSSAAEILVATLQTTRRALIMGSETCGCVLAIRNQHTLPDGGVLDVSELDYQTSQGSRLEEKGIKPDEIIHDRRQDLYAGRDRALEQALNHLAAVHSN